MTYGQALRAILKEHHATWVTMESAEARMEQKDGAQLRRQL